MDRASNAMQSSARRATAPRSSSSSSSRTLCCLLAGVLIAQRREHLQKFLTITFLIAGSERRRFCSGRLRKGTGSVGCSTAGFRFR